jgi:Rrf2 family iron-sulfur cluster assembly transcriptional regulator
LKLTTKGRFAVTAMLDIALHENHDNVTLSDISNCRNISRSYLEQLFAKLRKNGLVKGVRGPGGGYTLAADIESISVTQIILAVDEKIDFTRCDRKGDCQDGSKCLTHDLWIDLSEQLRDYLDSISLSDLVSMPDIKKHLLK